MVRHLIPLSLFLIPVSAPAADSPVSQPVPEASTGAVFTVPGRATAGGCQHFDVIPAAPGETARANKLRDLPPGDLLLAVMRKVEGCHKPVIVRYGLGAEPARQQPDPRPRRP